MTDTDYDKEMSKKQNEQTLSTRLQSLLEKPELLDKMLRSKPSWLETLDDGTPSSVIAGNLIASALSGDKKSIELIQKIAYGDRVVIDTAPGFFDSKEITIEIIDPKHKVEDGNQSE